MASKTANRPLPLALIGVGVALYVIAALVRTGSSGVMPTLFILWIAGMINCVIMLVVAFVVAALFSVSFGDIPSAILNFAAASLVAGGIAALIPMGWIIALFVFLGIIMWLFELEMTYAVAFTVIYLFVSWAIGIAIRSAMS
jgi:hypothetical protein